MSLLFLGDCHASWIALVSAVEAAAARGGISAVVQVGDFGFFPSLFARLEAGLRDAPFPLPVHVVDGNHEDHAWLRQLREDGTLARWASELNLVVHDRGETAQLGGVSVGFLGGALHVDRSQRGSLDKGTTNWVTDRQAEHAARAFALAQVELVVTHSCPHSTGVGMHSSPEFAGTVVRFATSKGFDCGPDDDCGEPGLTRLWSLLAHKPRSWVFGHFHRHHAAQVGQTGFRCVGSTDGSDGERTLRGHLFEPGDWSWSVIDLGRGGW